MPFNTGGWMVLSQATKDATVAAWFILRTHPNMRNPALYHSCTVLRARHAWGAFQRAYLCRHGRLPPLAGSNRSIWGRYARVRTAS